MHNIAIISEYNPFHNGHKFQIDQTRKILGENSKIISLMSGNFVQRGDFAILDKHTRAKMAVLGGVDLVFELPICYAISSAEFFARGSILALNKLNSIDYLCFGSECGNINILCEIADILLNDDFDIKDYMKTGVSYPKALDLALSKYDKNYSEIIRNPNNTLAIEYIKALKSTNSKIKPMTILRENVSHHSEEVVNDFASASYIRQNIRENISSLMPKQCFDVLNTAILDGCAPNNIKDVENSVLSFLKRKDENYFKTIFDVSEGLEFKIVKSLKDSTSLDELYGKIKSKRYTLSRIRRIILNAYLEITKENIKTTPTALKVLAFNDSGREVLRNLKDVSEIDIVTKPLDYSSYDKNIFNISTDLYSMCYEKTSLRVSSNELKKSPIYIGK